MMTYKPLRIDLAYRATFGTPLFALAGGLPRFLNELYTAVAPRFRFELTQVQALPGTSASDVGVRVGLFSGLAALTLKVEGLSAEFERLTGPDDLKIAVDCMNLGWQAVSAFAPDTTVQTVRLTKRSWLILDPDCADAILDGGLSPELAASLATENGERELQVRPTIRAFLESPNGEWEGEVMLDRSALPGASLFLACELTLTRSWMSRQINEQIAFLEQRYAAIARAVDLQDALETPEET